VLRACAELRARQCRAEPGQDDRQIGVQPVGLGGALGDELVTVVAVHLEVLGLAGVAGGWQVVLARGDAGDRQGVGRVGVARPAQPPAFADGQRAGHLANLKALVAQEPCQPGAEVGRALDPGPRRLPASTDPAQQVTVPVRGIAEGGGRELGAGLVDQASRQGVLVTVDPRNSNTLIASAARRRGRQRRRAGMRWVEARCSAAIPPDPDAFEGHATDKPRIGQHSREPPPKRPVIIQHVQACARSISPR
jgi:hypothetical protein